ncbi:MAG TPA: efflux RND transporter periplasmic adaptor subunit [Coleofasciculaceae cyanobacterium]|jgi:multidrug efflux pump subunit AcrA (membrane-fusion protein)
MNCLKSTHPQKSALALLVGLSMLLGGCGQQGGWKMPPPVIETSTALQRPWTITYTTTGTLEAGNKVDLNTETPGVISRILVEEGDTVRRGQVLMRLQADKQVAQVEQSVAGVESVLGNLEQQKSDIRQAEARLDSARRRKEQAQSELRRFEKLHADQFISQLELDQRQTNYDTALATYQEAEQALSSARSRYNQATSTLAQAKSGYRYNVALAQDTVIRAPFSGIVGQKYVDPGDYVAPTEKLITLVDPSTFKIQFNVPERYLDRLHSGMMVTTKFEGLGDTAFSGKVNFIDPVVDPNAHTVMVKAILPGGGKLRHGLFGTVSLALGMIPNAVVIPEEAIVPQGEKTFVYVVVREVYKPKLAPGEKAPPAEKNQKADDKLATVAHMREVAVEHREAGLAQVSSGLAPGEEVVTGGLQKVNDNTPVVLKSEMQSEPAGQTPKGH